MKFTVILRCDCIFQIFLCSPFFELPGIHICLGNGLGENFSEKDLNGTPLKAICLLPAV